MTNMLSEIMEQGNVLDGLHMLNVKCIRSITEEIRAKSIKHIIFAARGTSYHASVYGGYILSVKCGAACSTAFPSCVTIYKSAPFSEEDLVIGVSQSGQAADVIEVIEAAKSRGALTAAITNDCTSPLALSAKYHIYCGAGKEVSVAATKTFTAQMGAVLLLCAYISGDRSLIKDFEELPGFVKSTLENSAEAAARCGQRLKDAKDGFIISRGFTYPVALEAALKLQETCYVRMKGYSAADFMHGPIAQVDSDTHTIIFVPAGPAEADCMRAVKCLRDAGGQIILVTDSAAIADKESDSILIPYTGSEFTSPFVFAVFAQMLAESLSGLRGLNPDSPRNLKKVTVTI